jgi:hypothetical protein
MLKLKKHISFTNNPYNKRIVKFFALTVLLMYSTVLYSQSDHYWSQNFNTESSLVAGAVVGGGAGPSAVYYNPSLIDEENAHRLSLSANLLSGQYLHFKNHAGEGTKTDRFNLVFQPKFLSYMGKTKNHENITYELAVLTPIKKDYRIDYFYEDRLDIINRLDGPETYTGRIIFKDKYKDLYFGGGLSWKLNELFSIGVSSFLSVKILEYSSYVGMQAAPDSSIVYADGVPEPYYSAVNSYSEWVKYWDMSIIIKGGFHYLSKNQRLGLGLNVTLPNIHIYGEARVDKQFKRANVYDDTQNAFTENLDFIAYQEHMVTNVKDPLSIAAGLQYWLGKNKKNAVMFSAEYFFPIGVYSPIEARDKPTGGNLKVPDVTSTMSYQTSSRGVLNAAVGFIQYFSDRLTVAGGFRTDFNNFSTIDRYEERNSNLDSHLRGIYVNKYHIIVGPSFQIKTFGVILGIQYTWGRNKEVSNITSFVDPVEYNPQINLSLQGDLENSMRISYNEISIFFGVTYGFGDKKKQ